MHIRLARLLFLGVPRALILATALVVPSVAVAQDASALAKQQQNPVASLISVPFQANWDFGLGDRQAASSLLNVQPVMPFAVSQSTNLVLRVIMPLTSQPLPDGTRVNGLSDVVLSAFFSPAKSGRIIWGAGPVLLLPAATNSALGTEKFGVGPTFVVLAQPGEWTVGMLYNQLWSVSGAADRPDVNQSTFQPFAARALGNGLTASVSLEAVAAWDADERWNAPLLFGLSKVTLLGKRPVTFAVGAGPTVAGPEQGADWRFRFTMTLLFPR